MCCKTHCKEGQYQKLHYRTSSKWCKIYVGAKAYTAVVGVYFNDRIKVIVFTLRE